MPAADPRPPEMTDSKQPKSSLLILEPDERNSKVLLASLSAGYECEDCSTFEDAAALLNSRRIGVAVVNTTPAQRSAELLDLFREASPDTVIILLSREATGDEAIEAFRAGAFDIVPEPIEPGYVEECVARAFVRFEDRITRSEYRRTLEDLVAERTTALDTALEDIENSYRVTLKALVQALETRDFETHGHCERVVTFSLRLAMELGMKEPEMRDLELGALLHDIGKIGVPDAILRKPAKLTAAEWRKMKKHPVLGRRILRNIPFLRGAAKVVAQHHERWDGDGYPEGLRGEEINLGARIFAVIDAFDAMTSDRVYRKGRPYDDAVTELVDCSGSQFDPAIVEAFRDVPREDWEVLRARSLEEKQEAFSFQAVVEELVRSRRSYEFVN